MGHPVRIDGNAVERALMARSREPFVEELKRILEAGPSDKALRQFAAQHPDRWSQMISTMARLAGYTDKTESLELNFYLDLRNKSDMEVEQALEVELKRLDSLQGKDTPLIEVEARSSTVQVEEEENG